MWFFVAPSGSIASLQTLNPDYIHKKTPKYLILHLNSHYLLLFVILPLKLISNDYSMKLFLTSLQKSHTRF